MTDTTVRPTTISSLARDGLLNPDDARNLHPLEDNLNGYLGGTIRHALEPDLTYFLAASSGPLEQAVIEYLREAAGIKPEPGLRLISGDEFNQTGRKTIDLVVAKNVDGRWVPVIAVKAKFNAYVNGHRRYCTKAEKGAETYSNQAICYLHGCLHDDLHEDKVKFVWLGKPNTRPDLGAWGAKGVHAGDVARDPDYFGDGLGPQTDAAEKWCFATWDVLESRIAAAVPGPNGEAIVKALRAGW